MHKLNISATVVSNKEVSKNVHARDSRELLHDDEFVRLIHFLLSSFHEVWLTMKTQPT